MEFHEKIQELRKGKGLTQEELAQALYVSRTAVSKWESGRGYPNIDSLKALSEFYSVSIDELLSSEEVLTIAEEENLEKQMRFRDLLFGLLDLGSVLFFFLPIFGQKTDGGIQQVSLPALTEIAPYLKLSYFVLVVAMLAMGVLTLALQNYEGAFWKTYKSQLSLLLNALGVFLFILSPQAYGAALLFLFLAMKIVILIKKP